MGSFKNDYPTHEHRIAGMRGWPMGHLAFAFAVCYAYRAYSLSLDRAHWRPEIGTPKIEAYRRCSTCCTD